MFAGIGKLQSPTGAVAAKRAITRALARNCGAPRCFRYLPDQQHDFAKVNLRFQFVKNYFASIDSN